MCHVWPRALSKLKVLSSLISMRELPLRNLQAEISANGMIKLLLDPILMKPVWNINAQALPAGAQRPLLKAMVCKLARER